MKRVFSAEDIDREPKKPDEDQLNIHKVKDQLKQQRIRDIQVKKNKIFIARNIPSHLKTYVHALKS